jgi:hypothetical protein
MVITEIIYKSWTGQALFSFFSHWFVKNRPNPL